MPVVCVLMHKYVREDVCVQVLKSLRGVIRVVMV